MSDLDLDIGTEERATFKPLPVEVVEVNVVAVGEKGKAKKVELTVKHPEAEGTLKMSNLKCVTKGDKLEVAGLWFNKDSSGKLQKGSILANFLIFNACKNISELVGKKLQTMLDDNGYLVFKGY